MIGVRDLDAGFLLIFGGLVAALAKQFVVIRVFDFVPAEFLVIPVLIVLAVIVGIYPARAAYKTDVAKSLGK